MTKANKDGWIRHRGGKCPVEKGTRVDVRYRDGSTSANQPALEDGNPHELWAKTWEHNGTICDIMAYRLHTPKQQQEAKPMTAEEIRAQYMENLSSIAMLHTKNAALVDDLRKMGFDFYDAPTEPQEDMSDPKNWRVGDLVECVTDHLYGFTKGKYYKMFELTEGKTWFRTEKDDDGCECGGGVEWFKFHSRPTK